MANRTNYNINSVTCRTLYMTGLVVLWILLTPMTAFSATLSGVQSGTATSTGNGTTSVTITAVDPTKAFLVFQTRHSSNRPPGSMIRGRLNGAGTAVEFVRVSDETSTINIQWYVVEFSTGVSVQRGETTQSGATTNVAITAVSSTSQAFVLYSKTSASGDNQNMSTDDPLVGELTSTSNLQFRANQANSNHTIAWQVIEYTNAADINVQKGSTSLTGGTTSVDVTIPTAVNTANTFVLAGYRTSGSGADIGERMMRAQLIDSTTIRFDRDRTGDNIDEIVWQAIEIKDGTTVQHGSARINNGSLQDTVAITTVDTSRAIAFTSVQALAGQSLGKTFYNSDDIPGVGSATLALGASSFDIQRNYDGHRADFGWFVVEFPGIAHFSISHAGSVSTCATASVTIAKHSASHVVDTTYTGTITLSTSTGNGAWSLITGNGTLTDLGGGNATYVYAAADNGQVELGLADSTAETLNINVTDGTESENSGEDADLTFVSTVTLDTFRDNFTTQLFSNNDGTQNWAADWIEVDGAGLGPTSGNVQIRGAGDLELDDRPNTSGEPSLARQADLSTYDSATFTFDWSLTNGVDSSDSVVVEVSDNGGGSWTMLEDFTGYGTSSSGSRSFDISAYMTATTQVRFRVNNGYGGNNEKFRVDNVQIEVTTITPCAGTDHFDIDHDTLGISCLNEPVTVWAELADNSTDTSYTGTITLDTQSGTGTWTLNTGNGTFADATADDGLATYTYDATDNGMAIFNLNYSNGTGTVNIDTYEGTIRDDDLEGNLVFSPSGFTVTSTALTNPPPGVINTTIPAQTAATNFTLYLAAFGQTATDPTCGIIETYTGNQSLKFWSAYNDPATGTLQVAVAGSNVATSEAASVSQTVAFTNGQASITVNYPDAGQITLAMKDDTTGNPDLGANGIDGSSAPFVVKPADFVLSNIIRTSDSFANPGTAVDETGAAFMAAGDYFSVTVTAVNSLGNPTPNYGQESAAETVLLTPTLVAAGAANNPAIAFTTGFNGFVNGVDTGTDFHWDEVGIITLTPSVGDGDYLGGGDVTGTASANVGRFYPDHFVTAVSNGSFANTCATGTAFTYLGESFGYAGNPTVTATAVNAATATIPNDATKNYTGAWARLTTGGVSLSYPTDDNSQLDEGGVNPIAVSSTVGTLSRTDNTNGLLTFTLGGTTTDSFAYDRSLGQVVPFTADLTIQLTAVSDGEAAASDTPRSMLPVGNQQRFGRGFATDVHGTMSIPLDSLIMPIGAMYYDVGGTWTLNTDDSCSTYTYTKTDVDITTNASSASPVALANGVGDLILTIAVDGGVVGGSSQIDPVWSSWLKYNVDDVDQGADGNLYDDDPSATATFGIFRGDDRFLYWREGR